MNKDQADTLASEMKASHRNVAVLALVILFLVGCLWGTLLGGVGVWMILR